MKLIGSAVAISALAVAALSAQDIKTTTKDKTKIEVKDGRSISVVGCVERSVDGRYLLTDRHGDMSYMLVNDEVNLSKYVGRFVQVKGLATDRGDAKVQVEQTVGTSGEVDGRKTGDTKTTTTTKIEGDTDLRYLGVRSVKKLSDSCR